MVPLRDENPTQTTAYVTYGLILINVSVFLYQLTLNSQELSAFVQTWAMVPVKLTASFQGFIEPLPVWSTLITSQFLHGGFLHLGGNMLFLWIFGNNIEDKLGRVKYLLFYLSCGVFAALAQWYFSPPESTIPSLGASGAIAGVMGAYILRFPSAAIQTLIPLGILFPILIPFGLIFGFPIFPVVRIPAVFFLGFWFIEQAFNGVASLEVSMNLGGIAYWAHAGGFVCGFLLGPLLGLFADKALPSSRYDPY